MVEQNKPIMSKRIGRFQVSTWCFKRLRKAKNDFDAERECEVFRACVQYSKYDRRSGRFERQQIWCDPIELRSLAAVLDGLGDDEAEGGEQAEAALPTAISSRT